MTGLVGDLDKLRIATDAAGIALWSWNVDTDRLELDERGHVLWEFQTLKPSHLRPSLPVFTPKIWTEYEPLLQLPAKCSALTKQTFAFCTMAKFVGYPHGGAATIKVSSVGLCMACSSM